MEQLEKLKVVEIDQFGGENPMELIGIVMIFVGLVVIGKIICEEFGVNELITGIFWMIYLIIIIILNVAGQ